MSSLHSQTAVKAYLITDLSKSQLEFTVSRSYTWTLFQHRINKIAHKSTEFITNHPHFKRHFIAGPWNYRHNWPITSDGQIYHTAWKSLNNGAAWGLFLKDIFPGGSIGLAESWVEFKHDLRSVTPPPELFRPLVIDGCFFAGSPWLRDDPGLPGHVALAATPCTAEVFHRVTVLLGWRKEGLIFGKAERVPPDSVISNCL